MNSFPQYFLWKRNEDTLRATVMFSGGRGLSRQSEFEVIVEAATEKY